MRKTIKRALLWFSSLLHHNKKSKILYYHDVYSDQKYTDMGTSLDRFAQHIKVIRDPMAQDILIKTKSLNYRKLVLYSSVMLGIIVI